jgi:hypothetical protein
VLPSGKQKRIPVKSLSVAPPEVEVKLPVAYKCYNTTTGKPNGLSFDASVDVNTHGVYQISNSRNMFVVLGCNTVAYTENSDSKGKGRYDHDYYTGCVTYCKDSGSAQNGQCVGVGCCHVDIAPGLSDNAVTFDDGWDRSDMPYSPCDYAFLVDRTSYNFSASDLHMDKNRTMPVWLDWAIRDDDVGALSCEAAAKNRTRYACESPNSECVNSTNGPGYYCRCKTGYEGNPYQAANGCTSKYLNYQLVCSCDAATTK